MPEKIGLMPNNLIYQVVVYKNPKDLPGKYAARRFNITQEGDVPTDEVISCNCLRDIRVWISENYPNLCRMESGQGDRKYIYEVWI